MDEGFHILFYEEGDALDCRCIARFIRAFSQRYQETVTDIILNSEEIDQETFGYCLTTLLPSFKMTRGGHFMDSKLITMETSQIRMT